jgi:NAD(P)-dependent dehydrogenase (short-subunit alcohol dehydrogenase family)
MAGRLEGKAVLVTGAGSGIGRASALTLAREGARLVVNDLSAEAGQETVHQIEAAGGAAAFVQADVSQAAEVQRLIARGVEICGRLDGAFNNAGIGSSGRRLHEESEAAWDRMIAVNLKGVWLCLRAEIGQMLRQGGGAIVNTASVAGLIGLRGSSAYVAAKHGVVGLTRTAALECAQENIRVNAVCPGLVRTPLVAEVIARNPGREAMLLAQEPIGRYAEPAEIGEAVTWLLSDAASFVTGHAMAVDGAWLAQ